MQARLKIIGELELWAAGEPRDLPRSKIARALLAYLALSRRPVARERLCELFCAQTADPRAALRWALSKLREALGPAADALTGDRETVGVDASRLDVDMAELRRLLSATGGAPEKLLAIASGEQALAGARLPRNGEYEAWRLAIAGEALQLQKKALARALLADGLDIEERLRVAARLAEIDPADPDGQIARLEQLMLAGRKREAQQHVENARRILSEFGGEDRLIAAWRRLSAPAEPAPETEPEPEQQMALTQAVMARPAVAVLPFVELDADATDDYLADGVATEVIAGLSAWRLFPVISRNSSFLYKPEDGSASAFGRRIGARYVLTGAIRRAGHKLRLSVELLDSEQDQQVWSSRLDGDLGDVFELEDALVARIVQSVTPELETAERQRILRKRPEDLDAWDLALKAHWLANLGRAEAYEEAILLAKKAARLDPGFSLPHSLIAFIRFQQAMHGWTGRTDLPFREVFRATLDAARAALEIDPGSWMAHALSGVGELWTNRSHLRAADHLDRAIKLNPSGSWAYHFSGCIRGFNGELDTARFNQAQVFKVDPAYPYAAVVEADLGLWNLLDGDLEAAGGHLERSLSYNQVYGRGLQRAISLRGLTGEREAASEAMHRLSQTSPGLDRAYIETSYPFRKPEHLERFLEGFRRAGVNLAE